MKVISFVTMFVVALAAIFTVSFVLSAPAAYLIMLLLGVAHSFNDVIPALGFMELWILTFILGVLLSPLRSKVSE